MDKNRRAKYFGVITFLLVFNAIVITQVFTNHKPKVKTELQKCIEQSDYTDGDICDCLHQFGEDDELCGGGSE